jgi:HEAT repeat protein
MLNGVPVPYGAPTDELIQQAKGKAPARWAAFLALARDPSPQASDALREATRSDDPYVRRAAIEAVGARPLDPDSASLIVRALDDPDGRVVRTTCDAAATHRIDAAHDRVVRLVTSPDANTREVAVRALLALWQGDFTAVFEVFRKDRSPRVRKEAAWTLRKYVAAETWQPLFDVWSRDSVHRHRLWACEIAAEFGGPGVVEQLSLLRNDQDGLVRRAATKALSAIGVA